MFNKYKLPHKFKWLSETDEPVGATQKEFAEILIKAIETSWIIKPKLHTYHPTGRVLPRWWFAHGW